MDYTTYMSELTGKIQARVNPKVKEETEAIFEELRISASDAIRLFYHNVLLNQGLPFEVCIPNAETIAALEDTEVVKRFTSMDEFEDFVETL